MSRGRCARLWTVRLPRSGQVGRFGRNSACVSSGAAGAGGVARDLFCGRCGLGLGLGAGEASEMTQLFVCRRIQPEWKTYPGIRIPVRVKITTDRDTDIRRVATDVLALARMERNTVFDTTGAPIILRFARQVGGIMADVGQRERSPSYRFCMYFSKRSRERRITPDHGWPLNETS